MYDFPDATIPLEPSAPMPVIEESNEPTLVIPGEEPSGEVPLIAGDIFDLGGMTSSQDGGDTGGPIIVNGKRIDSGGGGGGGGGGVGGFFAGPLLVFEANFEPDSGEGGFTYYEAPDEPDNNDPPKVAAILNDPTNHTKVEKAAQALTDEIVILTKMIEALGPNGTITLPDNSIISVSEFQALWNMINFIVTDQASDASRAGALNYATGIATINADALNVAAGWGHLGVAFMAIHELVHYTAFGYLQTDYFFGMYEADKAAGIYTGEYNLNSPWFQENEEWANVGTRELLRLGGFEMPAGYDPGMGYEFGNLTR